ncbi:MAG: Gfo/Idh/MocA family oxidoreductase, partial [Chthonomonadales bacterium]
MPELMPLRWGILGAGNIAKKFTLGAQVNADMVVVAVGSRDLSKANAFAKELNIERAHGSYEALVSDPDIDVIYVATPHPHHKECTLLALNHSKPVLCEKPFTMNAGETEELIDAAHGARLFLMEGMWSRFFPAMFKLRELLAQKVI